MAIAMRVTRFACSLLLLCAAQLRAATPPAAFSALTARYCSTCHNPALKSGGLSFAALDFAHPEQERAQFERMIRKLRVGLMPPPGAPRPAPAELAAFAASLEDALDRDAALHPHPGRPALHRLNRAEYSNSIRDLLHLDIDPAALLPPDDSSRGFDNMSGSLNTSPALMDAWLRAASRIARLAVGEPATAAATATWRIPRVVSQTRHIEGTPQGTRGGIAVSHNFPASGDYTFRLVFYTSLDGPLFGAALAAGERIEISVDGRPVALLKIDPEMQSTDDLRTPPVPIEAGPHRIAAAFIQTADGPVEDDMQRSEQPLADLNTAAFPGLTNLPHLAELSVTGPAAASASMPDTPGRRAVFTCHPATPAEELPCARAIVTRLLRQAWRRPVTAADAEPILRFYLDARASGSFDSAIAAALEAILASPEFVFRFERTPSPAPAAPYPVSDVELASRLSFFLWSAPPDEPLLAAASARRLRQPGVIEAQVRRMLADPRASSLSTRFAAQWLRLAGLRDAQPDQFLFPFFNRNLADSMRRETELLFDSLIREDRSLLDLLTAGYTFVDENLARHYAIPGVLGTRFRRVPVTDENRRGILGHAGILTLTSISNRTSPVARGKYVLEVLLNTTPPAAPPNVPPLRTVAENAAPRTVRESMEAHRSQEPCRSCHSIIDPIGFSLENFDATGAWRAKDNGARIDSSGTLFDGTPLSGPASLRQALLARSDVFRQAFTENLLAYALGRVLEPADMPAVRAISRDAARSNNRLSSFIMGVVKSAPFRLRDVETAPAAAH